MRQNAPRGVADEIIYVPDSDMAGTVAYPNVSRKRDEWEFEGIESLKPFDGLTGFLVRTALIRSTKWKSLTERPVIRCSQDVAEICKHMRYLDHEEMVVLCLNAGNEVVAIHVASQGGRTGAATTSREILIAPILTASVGFVLVHNHPSGSLDFSREDLQLTRKAMQAADAMGLQLLDHVLVAITGHTSMLEKDMIDSLKEQAGVR